MKVGVGSTNPVKLRAAEEAFKKHFPHVQVEAVEACPAVSPQPLGFQETYLGALTRAKKAKEGNDFGVGLEAGLIESPCPENPYLDVQVCVITDGKKTSLGTGPGFQYPEKILESVMEGREIGEIFDTLAGTKNIRWKPPHTCPINLQTQIRLSQFRKTMN